MAKCVNDTPPARDGPEEMDMTLSGLIGQVVLPAVCAFGIVGNLLNLAILTRRKLQKSFRTLEQSANLCLISLAVSDLMFCVFALLTMFLPPDNIYDDRGVLLIYGVYCHAIINVFIMESTMLTVAMSLERFLAICFPLRQDIYLTTRRIKFVIVFTFIFSLLFNIPVLWRHEVVSYCNGSSNNITNNNNNITEGNSSSRFAGIPNGGNYTPLQEVVTIITTSTSTLFPAADSSTATLVSNIPGNNKCTTASVSNIPGNNKCTSASPSHIRSINHHSSTQIVSTLPQTSTTYVSTEAGLSLQKTESLSSGAKTLYTLKIVPFGGNQIYDNAYRLVWAFVGNFIPLLLLLYFNVCLFRKIYRSYKLRKQLGRQDRTKSSSHVLTITLVAIVVLFFILVAPSEVTLQMSYLTNSNDTPMYKNIEAVLNLMQSINFSVNFILYCIISPHFRKTLKYMMLCGCYRFYQVSKTWKKEFETSLL
ncbi:hypothetical protein BsWGS_15922 [Bradybaena similaris]